MSVASTDRATSTAPESHGYIRGFPPAPDRTITFQRASFRSFPELRWACVTVTVH